MSIFELYEKVLIDKSESISYISPSEKIGELLFDEFAEGSDNFVLSGHNEGDAIVITQYRKNNDCFQICQQIEFPIDGDEYFNCMKEEKSKKWLNLCFYYDEGKILYDNYYGTLPISDEKEGRVSDLLNSLERIVKNLELPNTAKIFCLTDENTLWPLVYTLQNKFSVKIVNDYMHDDIKYRRNYIIQKDINISFLKFYNDTLRDQILSHFVKITIPMEMRNSHLQIAPMLYLEDLISEVPLYRVGDKEFTEIMLKVHIDGYSNYFLVTKDKDGYEKNFLIYKNPEVIPIKYTDSNLNAIIRIN